MVRQTSIEAYHRIRNEGLLSKNRMIIYSILFQHGPLTGGEVGEYMMRDRLATGSAYRNVHARLCEMREMGVVLEIRERECRVTGMNVIEWDVTENLPKKPHKEDSIKCPHCKGTGKIKQGRLF